MSWTRSSAVKSTFVVLFVGLLTIKLFDLSVGAVSPDQDTKNGSARRFLHLKEHPPLLDQRVRPTDAYMAATDGLQQRDYRLRTDANGFIIGEKDVLPSAFKHDGSIMFLGGSTTECLYVDEEIRFPYLVSDLLGRKVFNGGVSGNHSMHSLLAFLGKGVPSQPSHVVLMHAVNDLGTLVKTLSYWDAPISRRLVVSSIEQERPWTYDLLRLVKNGLFPNTWAKVHHLFDGASESLAEVDEWAAYRDRKYDLEAVERELSRQFTASLESFVRVSRTWGIEPVLMTQFNRFRADDVFVRQAYERSPQSVSYDDYVRLYRKSNDIVRVVARRENVPLIDLDRLVPPNSDYMYDAVHLTDQGSRYVAEVVARSLVTFYPKLAFQGR